MIDINVVLCAKKHKDCAEIDQNKGVLQGSTIGLENAFFDDEV